MHFRKRCKRSVNRLWASISFLHFNQFLQTRSQLFSVTCDNSSSVNVAPASSSSSSVTQKCVTFRFAHSVLSYISLLYLNSCLPSSYFKTQVFSPIPFHFSRYLLEDKYTKMALRNACLIIPKFPVFGNPKKQSDTGERGRDHKRAAFGCNINGV